MAAQRSGRPLEGVGVYLGAGLSLEEEERSTSLVHALGATLVDPCEPHKAHALICNSVAGDNYIHVIRANPDVLIALPSWLEECHKQNRRTHHGSHKVKPLAGLVICITGFSSKERDGLPKLIAENGGHWSADLVRPTPAIPAASSTNDAASEAAGGPSATTPVPAGPAGRGAAGGKDGKPPTRGCTHLVAAKIVGEKFRYARQWGLPVANPQWLYASIERGRRVDEALYPITDDVTGAAAPTQLHGGALGAAGTTQAMPASLAPTQAGRGGQGGAAAPNSTVRGTVGLPGMRPGSATGSKALGTVSHAEHTPGLSLHDANAGAAIRITVPALPPDDCYFLDSVRMVVLGCSAVEMQQVLLAVRESGATREPAFSARTNHVLIGCQPSQQEVAALAAHFEAHGRQARVVRLNWLAACISDRAYRDPSLVAPDPSIPPLPPIAASATFPIAPTNGHHKGNAGMAGAGKARDPSPGTGNLLVQMHAASTSSLAGDASASAAAAAAAPTGGAAGPSSVFAGISFTLAALGATSATSGAAAGGAAGAGGPAGDEELAAMKWIKRGGGQLINRYLLDKVKDTSTLFAVCPFSFSAEQAKEVAGANKEFAVVPQDRRVTIKYLQFCVENNTLANHSAFCAPLWRPLGWALPIRSFAGIVLCCSGHEQKEKGIIEELVTSLGGTFLQNMSRRITHIIMQRAEGQKFDAALKWCKHVVRIDWLLTSAYQGTPIRDTDAYLPTGITRQQMQQMRAHYGALAAQARGGGTASGPGGAGGVSSSQRGPLGSQVALGTQLMPTQLPGAAAAAAGAGAAQAAASPGAAPPAAVVGPAGAGADKQGAAGAGRGGERTASQELMPPPSLTALMPPPSSALGQAGAFPLPPRPQPRAQAQQQELPPAASAPGSKSASPFTADAAPSAAGAGATGTGTAANTPSALQRGPHSHTHAHTHTMDGSEPSCDGFGAHSAAFSGAAASGSGPGTGGGHGAAAGHASHHGVGGGGSEVVHNSIMDLLRLAPAGGGGGGLSSLLGEASCASQMDGDALGGPAGGGPSLAEALRAVVQRGAPGDPDHPAGPLTGPLTVPSSAAAAAAPANGRRGRKRGGGSGSGGGADHHAGGGPGGDGGRLDLAGAGPGGGVGGAGGGGPGGKPGAGKASGRVLRGRHHEQQAHEDALMAGGMEMSQQVGYERSVMERPLAGAGVATRSSSRGRGRGGGAAAGAGGAADTASMGPPRSGAGGGTGSRDNSIASVSSPAKSGTARQQAAAAAARAGVGAGGDTQQRSAGASGKRLRANLVEMVQKYTPAAGAGGDVLSGGPGGSGLAGQASGKGAGSVADDLLGELLG